jgi:hypothetical protein
MNYFVHILKIDKASIQQNNHFQRVVKLFFIFDRVRAIEVKKKKAPK